MGKVIFLDIDGTVCNYEGVTPASAVDATGKQQRALCLTRLRDCRRHRYPHPQ